VPEMPEIYNLAEQMNGVLVGRSVQSVQVRQEKCINLPAVDFEAMLAGRSIERVTSKGKWLFTKLDGEVNLLINLGMGGDVLLHSDCGSVPEKYQLKVDFHDGSMVTIRFWWFGHVHAVRDSDLIDHKMTARLGPTPIRDAGFGEEDFLNRMRGKKGRIKNILLDQQCIAGIGNVYVQDILFRSKLHPNRRAETLTPDDRSLLYRSIVETLDEATRLGGLAYEKDLYNRQGGFKNFLVGYREGHNCPVCGAIIEKIRTGSTASFICPNCQR
jgi:formamidopyrimidine-DNA glycosylase